MDIRMGLIGGNLRFGERMDVIFLFLNKVF